MSKTELLSEVIQVRVTPKQLKKIVKLSQNEVLTTASFTRRHLVKTLKLKDDK